MSVYVQPFVELLYLQVSAGFTCFSYCPHILTTVKAVPSNKKAEVAARPARRSYNSIMSRLIWFTYRILLVLCKRWNSAIKTRCFCASWSSLKLTTVQVSYVCKDTFPSFSLLGVDVSCASERFVLLSHLWPRETTCVYAWIDLDRSGCGVPNRRGKLEWRCTVGKIVYDAIKR